MFELEQAEALGLVVEQSPDDPHGVRYTLPKRSFPLVARLFIVFLICLATVRVFRSVGAVSLNTAAILSAVFFICSGRGPLGWRGISTIELRQGRLISTRYYGPFPWRRTLIAGEIEQFAVGEDQWLKQDFPGSISLGIRVQTARGAWWMAKGYDRKLLEGVVDDLSWRVMNLPRQPDLSRATSYEETQQVEVRHYPSYDPFGLTFDVTEKPRASQASHLHTPQLDEILIPPLGFFKTPTGIGSLVLGFTFAVGAIFVAIVASPNAKPEQDWLVAFGVVGFIGAWLFHLVRAIRSGCTAVDLHCEREFLRITWHGVLSTRILELPNEAIEVIRIANVRIKGASKSCMQLWIFRAHHKPLKLLEARDPDELRWIATTLRTRLRKPADG